jgi:hypothetical protein
MPDESSPARLLYSRARMPDPRPLLLEPLPRLEPAEAFTQFMRQFEGDTAVAHMGLPSGDRVTISDNLFKSRQGEWKLAKRGRDVWLLYLAELAQRPQEIWLLSDTMVSELHVLGRFQRGTQRIDALLVFERNDHGQPWMGKTAFVSDRKRYLGDIRRGFVRDARAKLVWQEM